MKNKEIQAELKEKINQLIDKLHEISDDTIAEESKWIKRIIKNDYTLEECLNMSIKYLVHKAIDNITSKDK